MASSKKTEVFCILQNIRNLQDDFDFITLDISAVPQWEDVKSKIKSQLKLEALSSICVNYVKIDDTEYTIGDHEDWISVLKMAEQEKNQILLKVYPEVESAAPDSIHIESSTDEVMPMINLASHDGNDAIGQFNFETDSCLKSDCEESMEIEKFSTVLDEKMSAMEERLVKRLLDNIKSNQENRTAAPVRHSQVVCDNCDENIIGVRYKCGNCNDFDLCEKCEAIEPSVHDASHVFLKIKTPLNNRGFKCRPILPFNLYEDVTQKVRKLMHRSSRCRKPNDLLFHLTAPSEAFPQLGSHGNDPGVDSCNNFKLFVDNKTGKFSLGSANCEAPQDNQMYDVDLVDCWLQRSRSNSQSAPQQNIQGPSTADQGQGNFTPHPCGDIQQAFHQMSLSNPFNAEPNIQNSFNDGNVRPNCSFPQTQANAGTHCSMHSCGYNTNSAPNVCTRQPPFGHPCNEPQYPYPSAPNPYFGGGFVKTIADLTNNVFSSLGMTASNTTGQSIPPPNSDDNNKAMMQLLKMGFVNRKLNATLLEKHNNNVERVVDELIREINSKRD